MRDTRFLFGWLGGYWKGNDKKKNVNLLFCRRNDILKEKTNKRFMDASRPQMNFPIGMS